MCVRLELSCRLSWRRPIKRPPMTTLCSETAFRTVRAYLRMSRIVSAASRTLARKFVVTPSDGAEVVELVEEALVGHECAASWRICKTACDFALLARDRTLLRDKPASVRCDLTHDTSNVGKHSLSSTGWKGWRRTHLSAHNRIYAGGASGWEILSRNTTSGQVTIWFHEWHDGKRSAEVGW
jgi:hypothetical protein